MYMQILPPQYRQHSAEVAGNKIICWDEKNRITLFSLAKEMAESVNKVNNLH